MRIAQVVSMSESVPPASKNGLEFVVSWLTEELVKRGHEVTLFAPGDSVTSAKLVSILPQSISSNPKTAWELSTFSIWNTLIAASQSKEFDIIHCHNINAAYIVPFVSCPVIETNHHAENGDFFKLYLGEKKYRDSLKSIIDFGNKVHHVFVSKNQERITRNLKETYLELPTKHIDQQHTVIHNGIPAEAFLFNDSPSDYLLFLGYINKNKGADVAVQVAKATGMKLILAGTAEADEKFFKEQIQPFLDEKITYVGPVDFTQKNELYKNALATLAPLQWDEPFGLTIIESQECGTPVISFNKGASSEIISHGNTGFVVETFEEMVESIGKITDIKRQNCRDWVVKNFSVSRMVDEYEDLYENFSYNNNIQP